MYCDPVVEWDRCYSPFWHPTYDDWRAAAYERAATRPCRVLLGYLVGRIELCFQAFDVAPPDARCQGSSGT